MTTSTSDRVDYVPFRLTWRTGILAVLLAAGIAFVTTAFILRYYAFYHLSSPPGDAAVVMLALPTGFAATTAVILVAMALAHWRRLSRRTGFIVAASAGFGLALGVSAYEIHRTTEARSGEGEGAGDLAPFVGSLIGMR